MILFIIFSLIVIAFVFHSQYIRFGLIVVCLLMVGYLTLMQGEFFDRFDYFIPEKILVTGVMQGEEKQRNYLLDLNAGTFSENNDRYLTELIIKDNESGKKYNPTNDYYYLNGGIFFRDGSTVHLSSHGGNIHYRYWSKDGKYIIAYNNLYRKYAGVSNVFGEIAIDIFELSSGKVKQIMPYQGDKLIRIKDIVGVE